MASLSKEIVKDILIAAAVLGVAYYVTRKGLAAINPMDSNNVINQAAESVYRSLTGSDGNIGGDIYDVLHDQNGGNVLNPANQNNVIYKRISSKDFDLGTWVYDVFH